MAKEELIQFEGLVTEILPDARYRVQLDAGHEIVAYTAGKMKSVRRFAPRWMFRPSAMTTRRRTIRSPFATATRCNRFASRSAHCPQ